MKAELHRPWLLPVRAKKEFIVFEHIDINTPLLLVGTLAGDALLSRGFSGSRAELVLKLATCGAKLCISSKQRLHLYFNTNVAS